MLISCYKLQRLKKEPDCSLKQDMDQMFGPHEKKPRLLQQEAQKLTTCLDHTVTFLNSKHKPQLLQKKSQKSQKNFRDLIGPWSKTSTQPEGSMSWSNKPPQAFTILKHKPQLLRKNSQKKGKKTSGTWLVPEARHPPKYESQKVQCLGGTSHLKHLRSLIQFDLV